MSYYRRYNSNFNKRSRSRSPSPNRKQSRIEGFRRSPLRFNQPSEPIIEEPEDETVTKSAIKQTVSKSKSLVSLSGGANSGLTATDKNLIRWTLIKAGLVIYTPDPRSLELSVNYVFTVNAIFDYKRYLLRNNKPIPWRYSDLKAQAIIHRREKLNNLALSKRNAQFRIYLAGRRALSIGQKINKLIPTESQYLTYQNIAVALPTEQTTANLGQLQTVLGFFNSIVSGASGQSSSLASSSTASANPEILEFLIGLHGSAKKVESLANEVARLNKDTLEVSSLLYKHLTGKEIVDKDKSTKQK